QSDQWLAAWRQSREQLQYSGEKKSSHHLTLTLSWEEREKPQSRAFACIRGRSYHPQRDRGMPRPAMAMMSRCTSLVPPHTLELGAHAREVELHPGLIDHAATVAGRGLARPSGHVLEQARQQPHRHQRDAFVIELRNDQPPTLVLGADQGVGRHAHVLEIGRV